MEIRVRNLRKKGVFSFNKRKLFCVSWDSLAKLYVLHSYTVKSSQGEAYTIKINSLNDARKDREDYDGFSIQHKGKNLLTYYTGGPLYNYCCPVKV